MALDAPGGRGPHSGPLPPLPGACRTVTSGQASTRGQPAPGPANLPSGTSPAESSSTCSALAAHLKQRHWAGRPPLGCFRCAGTEEPRAAALARVGDIEGSWLRAGLDDAFALVAGRFFRREVRVRARACLGGMLSGLERKTSWSLAEHAGEPTPEGMQRPFTTARWDTGDVRDDVRGYVAATLGSPDGVLIGDGTGLEKGGSRSAGVQQAAKNEAGMDHYQVRRYESWYRYTLAMLALAFLTVTRAGPLSQTAVRAWPARPARSAACSPRSAHRPATSSTPATGHDGAATTKNAPTAATTSDNDCKCREPIYPSSASRGFRAS